MIPNDFEQFINDISTEIAGGRIDHALLLCLKHGYRPTLYLLRKGWSGTKVFDRWMRGNCYDLKLAYLWAAGLVAAGAYYDSAGASPVGVQFAIVVPLLGFAALVVTDKVRRVRRWISNRRCTEIE